MEQPIPLSAVWKMYFSVQQCSVSAVLKICIIAGKLLNSLKIPQKHPRIKKSLGSFSKSPPFPLSAIDLWHFIMEAGPLQLNRQSGQAASDSLTVCLNSGWRLCFHSPGQTPSAKAAQLPRLYLHLDLPSMSGVYALVCQSICVWVWLGVFLCTHTHTHMLTSNQQWQASLPVCKEMGLTWKGKWAVIWFSPRCGHARTHTLAHT